MIQQTALPPKATRHIRPKPAVARQARSVNEVADILGLGSRTIWALIERHEIRAVKIGGRTLVPVTELDRILDPERNPVVTRDAG